MTLKTTIEQRIGITQRTKALAAGLLVAGMMASGMMAAAPAQGATTFTVNSTADAPDASLAGTACDTDVFTNGDQCTLRAAIQQANATAGADLINFAIPGTGVKTINVGATGLGALPAITEQLTIDGYTQPGSSPNTRATGNNAVLKIELNGASAPDGSGLEIASSSNSVIKGLVINRFGIDGIEIHGSSTANRVEGNFIGTDPTGTIDRGNGFDAVGIFSGPSGNLVGGTTPASRNVLSGNGDTGLFVSNTSNNRAQGNYVGTDKSGTKDLGNEDGGVVITASAADNVIGGTTAGARNLISGNDGNGILIKVSSAFNEVIGNRIGTTASGTGALGNSATGVAFDGASNNLIGDGSSAGANTIAFNGQDGVAIIGGSILERISRNSIFSNAELGIDLAGGVEDAQGNTANDPGDVDSGPNGLQNKPVLSSAKTVSGKTTITGKLDSLPNEFYKVALYSNPSGNEGKKFIGQKIVTTDASGNASFTFSPAAAVSAGQTVTATAQTAALEATAVGTSEFSAPKKVASS